MFKKSLSCWELTQYAAEVSERVPARIDYVIGHAGIISEASFPCLEPGFSERVYGDNIYTRAVLYFGVPVSHPTPAEIIFSNLSPCTSLGQDPLRLVDLY
jgi:hypothetical protein